MRPRCYGCGALGPHATLAVVTEKRGHTYTFTAVPVCGACCDPHGALPVKGPFFAREQAHVAVSL